MITPMSIADVLLIKLARYGDEPGWFSETFSLWMTEKLGLPRFVQDNESLSRHAGTVRGLHFQRRPYAQAKLVRCVQGSIFDVALDIRSSSPTLGQHVAMRMSANEDEQMFVPAGFAHGYCALEPNTVVQSKVSAPYAPAQEGSLFWNDPALKINWPVSIHDARLSSLDQVQPTLAQLDLTDV